MTRETGPLIGAIDQGTSSTRFLVFDSNKGELITYHQIELQKVYVEEGWVEQNPQEILKSVHDTIDKVIERLKSLDIDPGKITAIGLCNQRESTIVWDKETGEPLYNSIVWLDNRTKDIVESILDSIPGRDINFFKHKTGLPISTYFSAFKLKWLIDNVVRVKEKMAEGRLLFGTVDSWILWNLTKKHLTDVTNASRTFLMDLEALAWDEHLCKFFDIPMNILPKILPSADMYGNIEVGPLKGIPIAGVIGDQSSALIGQNCLHIGQTKATYGTGCFIVQNIGTGSVSSCMKGVPKEAKGALITTVAFQFANQPPVYALEGSIAIAGAAITWLRDNLKLITEYKEIESLAKSVPDSGGVFFVPAFQGLYAPYWDPSASGTMIGLSQFSKKEHIVRATLESIAFQTADVLSLMRRSDTGINVDGGMSCNDLMCQTLADINGIDVIRPSLIETTALGAAMVAGHTMGYWNLQSSCSPLIHESDEDDKQRKKSFIENMISFTWPAQDPTPRGADVFKPTVDEHIRQERLGTWRLAVNRAMKWTKIKKQEIKRSEYRRRSTIPIGIFVISSFALLLLSSRN